MSTLKFLTGLLFLFSFNVQGQANKDANSQEYPILKDSVILFKKIVSEICTCTRKNMRNNNPFTAYDSCYILKVTKYTDSLKYIEFDPNTTTGKNRVSNYIAKIALADCQDIGMLIEREFANLVKSKFIAKPTTSIFRGKIVSQTKLPTGEFKIILIDQEKKTMIFKSTSPLITTESKITNNEDYEATVEYEVKRNTKNKKDEFNIIKGVAVLDSSVDKTQTPK